MTELRPYQSDAVAQVLSRAQANPLLVAPTGAGKTAMAAAIARSLDVPILFLAHTRLLVRQAADRLSAEGLDCGIVMAGVQGRPLAQVQVASRDTLIRRRPLTGIRAVLLDEAHHAASDRYRSLLAAYQVPRIGLTATPFRLDGKPLSPMFGDLVVSAYADELVDAGYLIAPTVYVPKGPDLTGVHIRHGDYAEEELEAAVNTSAVVGNVVSEWIARAPSRKTIAFAVTVAHSRSIVQRFLDAGIRAVHLDASSSDDERRAAVQDLEAGRVKVLSNVGLFGEGWDLPALDCALLCRPTASLQVHLQQVGRVARACADKADAVILDCAGNHERHGLMTDRLTYSLTEKVQHQGSKAKRHRPCDRCQMLVPYGTAVCPSCGFERVVETREVEERDGELTEFRGKRVLPPYEERREAWDHLVAGLPRGREGLACRKFKAMFGIWPVVVDGHLVDTERPTDWERQQVFKKFAIEWLRRPPDERQAVGYCAARYKAAMGVFPPWRWTEAVKRKAEELAATAEPLLSSPGVPHETTH